MSQSKIRFSSLHITDLRIFYAVIVLLSVTNLVMEKMVRVKLVLNIFCWNYFIDSILKYKTKTNGIYFYIIYRTEVLSTGSYLKVTHLK